MKIRHKLIGIVLTPVLIVLITLQLIVYQNVLGFLKPVAENEFLEQTKHTVTQLDSELQKQAALLKGVARTLAVSNEAVDIQKIITEISGSSEDNPPPPLPIYIALQDGRFFHSLNWKPPITYIPTLKKWFRDAEKTKAITISPSYGGVNKARNEKSLIMSYPIYNDDAFLGVIALDLPISQIRDTILSQVIFKTGSMFLLTDIGEFLAHPKYDLSDSIFMVNDPELKQASRNLYLTSDNEIVKTAAKNGTTLFTSIPVKSSNWLLVASAPENEVLKTATHISRIVFIVSVVGVLALIILVIIASGILTKPLKTTVSAMKNIAEEEGDLTVRLNIESNDEMGNLARYFNLTVEKIHNSIKHIKTNIFQMQTYTDGLSSEMNKASDIMNTTTHTIDTVIERVLDQSKGVKNTATQMQTVYDAIKGLGKNINDQSSAVVESSASIEQMIANINSVNEILTKNIVSIESLEKGVQTSRESVTHATTLTEKIAEKSQGLLKTSEIIENISNQTNVLAMNAAIQAAHAGEAGKGFAVVAGEIRKLAEGSSLQSKSITSVLGDLKSIIDEVTEATRTVQEQFEQMFTITKEVSTSGSIMQQAMAEQSNGSSQVLEAIHHINTITSNVREGSEQMLDSSAEILNAMQDLSSNTELIHKDMSSMIESSQEIGRTVQQVKNSANESNQEMKDLTNKVEEFHI